MSQPDPLSPDPPPDPATPHQPKTALGKLLLALVHGVAAIDPRAFAEIDVNQALREADGESPPVGSLSRLAVAVKSYGLRRAGRETGISPGHLSRFLKGQCGMIPSKQQRIATIVMKGNPHGH